MGSMAPKVAGTRRNRKKFTVLPNNLPWRKHKEVGTKCCGKGRDWE